MGRAASSPMACTALLAASALLVFGCAKRPDYLSREESLDELCSKGMKAYAYDIEQKGKGKAAAKIPEDAVETGCEAPIAAWTDYRDKAAGGARGKAYQLRNEKNRTFLCCKD